MIFNLNFYLFIIYFIIYISCAFLFFSTNPVKSLLWFILILCCYSLILLILGLEFISFLIFIIYIGAIMVLFLFVVMMLNIKILEIGSSFFFYLPIGIIILVIFILNFSSLILLNFGGNVFNVISVLNLYEWIYDYNYVGNLYILGHLLYSFYALFFFICGLLLLISMVGAIMLTL